MSFKISCFESLEKNQSDIFAVLKAKLCKFIALKNCSLGKLSWNIWKYLGKIFFKQLLNGVT